MIVFEPAPAVTAGDKLVGMDEQPNPYEPPESHLVDSEPHGSGQHRSPQSTVFAHILILIGFFSTAIAFVLLIAGI